MPQCPDVTADKQDLGPGSRGPLFTVWCPRSVQGPSDLVGGLGGYGWGACKNCEAGAGKQLFRTEIATRRKHEICAHLLPPKPPSIQYGDPFISMELLTHGIAAVEHTHFSPYCCNSYDSSKLISQSAVTLYVQGRNVTLGNLMFLVVFFVIDF